ncbi:MAG TPA: MiaB/RimO family radical SAM methylthiotransferase [bacterium]|nr:MiaB/RimO family radical SAM methylthiotransferase [bacterium]
MKVFYEILGCWKNIYDSEEMIRKLIDDFQVEIVKKIEEADLCIINTCCFIDEAREENLEIIAYYNKIKAEHPEKKVVLYGCFVQLYKEELQKDYPLIDKMFKLSEKEDLYNYIREISKELSLNLINKKIEIAYFMHHIQFLKISEGCNNHCNYCIIPSIRGSLKSKEISEIINEIKEKEKKSRIREYILIAQDTMSYGKDRGEEHGLVNLVKAILKELKGKKRWLRIMYMHPKNFEYEILELMKNSKIICRYFDLPIQHSEDKILKLMNRGYTKNDIMKLIERIKKELPKSSIRTTVIIGHPEETEEDFENLYNFLKEGKIDFFSFFKYSLEKYSKDYNLYKDNKFNKEIIERRLEKLAELQYELIQKASKRWENDTRNIIIDEYDEEMKKYLIRSEFQAPEIDGNFKISLSEIKDLNLKVGQIY